MLILIYRYINFLIPSTLHKIQTSFTKKEFLFKNVIENQGE